MCECGCGSFCPQFKFAGPRGITYVIELYPGCDNCSVPAGMMLYAFDKADCELWGIDTVPDIEISNVGSPLPIIDKDDLMKLMRIFWDDNVDAQDICEDSLDECFTDAARIGIEKTRKMYAEDADSA